MPVFIATVGVIMPGELPLHKRKPFRYPNGSCREPSRRVCRDVDTNRETGRCKKNARPPDLPSSMLECGLVRGGGEKKAPDGFRLHPGNPFNFELGGDGAFFRTDRYPLLWR